jgi:FSR family fosmidomycin resistance protein-like MFS transporter
MENDHTEQDKSTLKILTIAGGHFINDSFMAFIPALLPLLIQKLSLSLTTAGTLSAIAQLPAVLNPMIGYVADRHRLQWAVILSPGITATMISLLGIAPNEPIIAFLIYSAA